MESSLRIIVTGLIAQYPLGGVAWDYLQYALGLARLGHDVYYFEDTGQSPYNPVINGLSDDYRYTVNYLSGIMERFGLAERWAYHFPYPTPRWFGLSDGRRADIVNSADLLINVSGTLAHPAAYRSIKTLAFVDSDPVFTQVKLARGQLDFRKIVDTHDVHFSFGEHLSDAVPTTGHTWRPTRQPVVLSQWDQRAPFRDAYTTVMNWTSYNPVEYDGKTYGQKDLEFKKFLDLPTMVAPTVMEVAVNDGRTRRAPRDLLAYKGWRVADPSVVCPDLDSYRSYITTSKGEWSVAKNGYVLGQAGWFSCRSACYLASGRPVVVQDTGFSPVIPVGEGVLTFRTVDEAAAAICSVERDYTRHSRAARGIAEQYFDSSKVLSRLVDDATSTYIPTRNAT